MEIKILKRSITLCVLLYLLVPQMQADGQVKRSNISIHSCAYYTNHILYPQYRDHDFLLLMGINYKYYIKKRVALIADYTCTTNQPDLTIGVDPYIFSSPKDLVSFYRQASKRGYYYDPTRVGKLVNRINYNFFKIGICYDFFSKKKQKLSISMGISYAYGRNKYITALQYAPKYPVGMGDLFYTDYVLRWNGYWGGFIGLGYDYMLWHNRINVGVTVTTQEFEGSMPFFINYGFQAGYNF